MRNTEYYGSEMKRYMKIIVVLPIIIPIVGIGMIAIGLEEMLKKFTDLISDSIDDGVLDNISKWVNR